MRWLVALLRAQLAFATHHARQAPSDQVPLVNTTYNNYAMNPMFRYVPKMEWPRDPADGWNFSTTICASSPYDGPEKGLAFPYTTLAGASVGQRFVGNGITVYGWAGADTRFRLPLSSDLASDITVAQRFEGELATAMAPDNRWIDFNLTLIEGALQVFNISIHQQLHLDYPSQDAAPQPYMKAIEDDGVTINPFFTVEGDVVAKIGDIEGEGPLIAVSPGAQVSFRTWPKTTMVRLLGQVGREGGVIAYELVPEPAEVRIVTWDLLRTHDYFMDVGYHLIDPKQRFTFKVSNEHPRSRIYFRGVSFLIGVEEAMKWDPLTDAMKEDVSTAYNGGSSGYSSSTSTGTSKDIGHNNGGSSSGGSGGKSEDDQGAGGKEPKEGKHTSAGAIAGGVVGGLVGGALLGLAILACLFPARFTHLLPGRQSPQPHAGGFDVDDPELLDVTEASSHPVVTPLPAPEPKADPSLGHSKSLWAAQQSEKEAQQPLSGTDRQTTEDPGEEHREIEDDAGPVPVQPRHADTLPPTYNPAWAGTNSALDAPSDSGPCGSGLPHDYKALASTGASPSKRPLSDAEKPHPHAAPLPVKRKF